jgi:hypothetical protein
VPSQFVYGQVALNFRVDGNKSRAIFHYKYDIHDDTIDYIDIEYTNPKLRLLIEGNSKMMENIDRYIRNLLLKNKNPEEINE